MLYGDPGKEGMFAHVNKFEKKPYPSVDGIKQVFALYDSPEMRRHTPEEFYDSSLMVELDKSGFLDNPKSSPQLQMTSARRGGVPHPRDAATL